MKKQVTLRQRKGIPKRVLTIGTVLFISLFLICCAITFALSGNSQNKTQTSSRELSDKSGSLTLPTLANTATIVNTEIPTTVATETASPAPTSTPVPTLAASKLNDCLPDNAKNEPARLVKIVDGDTIDVNINGAPFTVRYIGIDTPETKDPDSPVQFYGPEATNRNTELVANKEILLVKDSSETDQYGRLLRYVFADGIFVNETLVKEGYAHAKAYPPDTSCHALFTEAEEQAKTQALGLWSAAATSVEVVPTLAPTQPPVSNTDGCPQGCLEEKPGCAIKGNINNSGEKIYHVPGSTSYSKTKIDPSNGERWFCTANEAISNGWRAPNN